MAVMQMVVTMNASVIAEIADVFEVIRNLATKAIVLKLANAKLRLQKPVEDQMQVTGSGKARAQ